MSEINYKLIGIRLKQARELCHISLEEAGNKVGVNKSTIMRWENGKTEKFKIPTLEILAKFYNVNPAWLMGHNVSMKKISNNITNGIYQLPLIKKFEKNLNNSIEKHGIGYIPISSSTNDLTNCFALQITDDTSMAPLLDNSDIAIVHLQNDFESGRTYLLTLDNKTLIRKILKLSDSTIELHAMNPYYPVIILSKNEINKRKFKVIGRIIKAENNTAFK